MGKKQSRQSTPTPSTFHTTSHLSQAGKQDKFTHTKTPPKGVLVRQRRRSLNFPTSKLLQDLLCVCAHACAFMWVFWRVCLSACMQFKCMHACRHVQTSERAHMCACLFLGCVSECMHARVCVYTHVCMYCGCEKDLHTL